MDHIGDYTPKVGERFRVVNFAEKSGSIHNGKIVTIQRVYSQGDFCYQVIGLFEGKPEYGYNLRATELAFLKPSVSDLGDWM